MLEIRLLSPDDEVIGWLDPAGDLTFTFEEVGTIARIAMYAGNFELCEINKSETHINFAPTETITIDFDNNLPVDNTVWQMVLRMHYSRPSHVFGLIQQAGAIICGEKTRKSVYNIRAQAPAPTHQAVQNEEPQRLRWWSPRRLVQWLKK